MRKKLLLVVAGIGLAVSMNAQTLYVPGGTSGIGTSTNGNVGIGTTNTSAPLTICNSTTSLFAQTAIALNNNYTANADVRNWAVATDSYTYGDFGIYVSNLQGGNPLTTGTVKLLITEGGNVGIGTTIPSEKLHVLGNSIITGIIKAGTNSGTITQTATYPYSTTIETGADAGQILINAGSTSGYVSKISISGSGNGSGIQFYTKSAEIMRVNDGGNVLIGKTTQTNTTYKLDVAGKIRADEITVNTTGADFVFAPTYKLRTLAEVETFIKANQHLPDVAPAAEMQTNGVSMGDMQAKLLQKVEELMLYSIEQDKKLKEQEKKLQGQGQENAAMQLKLAIQEQEMKELKELVMKKLK